jgi:hypothetical protein
MLLVWRDKTCSKIFVGKTCGKLPFGRNSEKNIRMELREKKVVRTGGWVARGPVNWGPLILAALQLWILLPEF